MEQAPVHACYREGTNSLPSLLQAFEIMEQDLGRPIAEVFSCISEHPIAAASLGQVGRQSAAAPLSHFLPGCMHLNK